MRSLASPFLSRQFPKTATMARSAWLDPETVTPPTGETILIKTRYGRAIIGKWDEDGETEGALGWQYLPA